MVARAVSPAEPSPVDRMVRALEGVDQIVFEALTRELDQIEALAAAVARATSSDEDRRDTAEQVDLSPQYPTVSHSERSFSGSSTPSKVSTTVRPRRTSIA